MNNTPEDWQKLGDAASQETDATKLRAILSQIILAATQAQERVHAELDNRLAKANGTAQATDQP